MKNLVVLGAGTAGTMVANHLRNRLPHDWQLSIVDPDDQHVYQPGLLFLPFGARDENRMIRRRESTLGRGVQWVQKAVRSVDTTGKKVELDTGEALEYDLLVLASGSQIRPEETDGLYEEHWHRTIHDYYTLEGARVMRDAMANFRGGRLVLNVVEMPIKCPIAPLEFLFLADDYFKKRGIRNEVELIYATPLDGAFTKPIAARMLGELLEEKGIVVEAEFNTAAVDGDAKVLSSWDERQIAYDMLVSIPTHMGAAFIDDSGLGDDLGFIPTDPKTLLANGYDDIFVLGDATNLPTSKAGSVAHFQAEVVVENIQRTMTGRALAHDFDGHANCFIETGEGKGLLIDFNYDVEPLPGSYPMPLVGPFSLLKETRRNHWGKLAFRWLYWNMLLPGRHVPVSTQMSMIGKREIAIQAA
jgi:sulfide:quinone oxidoreductase